VKELTDEKVVELLRNAMPALGSVDAPQTDLWPAVLTRVDRGREPFSTADCLLALVIVVLCLARPSLFALLLLHF
jgi:hypothetical protein